MYHRYLNDLYVISKSMADQFGCTQAFHDLVAEDQSNPFAKWERKIEQGQALIREDHCLEAARLLSDYLIDVRDLDGYGYRHLAATTHWYISQAHGKIGRRNDAVAHAEQALFITQKINDHSRYLHRYLEYLLKLHRLFGENGLAAEYAEKLVEFFATREPSEADRYRKEGRMLRRSGGKQ